MRHCGVSDDGHVVVASRESGFSGCVGVSLKFSSFGFGGLVFRAFGFTALGLFGC